MSGITKGQYFYLTAETSKRLRVCAALTQQTMSAVVEKALEAYLTKALQTYVSQPEPQTQTKVFVGNTKSKESL